MNQKTPLKDRRASIISAGILLAFLLFFVYIFAFAIIPGISNGKYISLLDGFNTGAMSPAQTFYFLQNANSHPQRDGTASTITIYSNQEVRQTFFLTRNIKSVQNLRLELAPESTANADDTIHVRVTNFLEDAVYLDKDFSLGDVLDGDAMLFQLDSPIYGIGEEYHIYLDTGEMENRSLALASTPNDSAAAHLNIAGQEEMQSDLLISTALPNSKGLKALLTLPMLLCWLAIAVAVCGRGLLDRAGKEYSVKKFVCVMLLLGFAYMILFPPPYAPDEGSHMSVAYEISNHILGVEDTPNADDVLGTIYMRKSDKLLMLEDNPNLYSYENVLESFAGPTDTQLVEQGVIKPTDARISYILPAIGITIGRLMGASTGFTIFLGRSLNLLFITLLLALAIRILPTGKELAMFISFNPLVLQNAASYSHHAFLYGFAPVYIAVCMYYYFKEKKLDVRSLTFILLGGLTVTAVRNAAYAPLAFIFLIIPKERFKNQNTSKWIKGIFSVIFLVGTVSVLRKSAEGAWYDDGSVTYWSFGEIAKNPVLIVRIALDTILEYSPGGSFLLRGYVSAVVPWMLFALGVLTLLPLDSEHYIMKKKDKCITGVISIMVLAELFAAIVILIPKDQLPWVHSRYYLLLLLPAGLMLKGSPIRLTGITSKKAILSVEIMLSALVIGSTFASFLSCY